jgi:hypothetical protein
MDSLCFTDHTRGQDILHIFSSKQTVELLLIETCGQDMLREKFQFMGKITLPGRKMALLTQIFCHLACQCFSDEKVSCTR